METEKTNLPKIALAGFIQNKARKKNKELGFDYYSENPDDYTYSGAYEDKENCVFYFTCPNSFSTVSVAMKKI